METLVVIVEADGWDLHAFGQALDPVLQVKKQTIGNCLEISQDESHAYVCVMGPDDDGLFEDWPKELVPEGPFTAFSVDYRKHTVAETIVSELTRQAEVVIDTNFGEVLSGRDFVSRLAAGEGSWEWWHWDDED